MRQLRIRSALLAGFLGLLASPCLAAGPRWTPYGPPAGALITLAVDTAGRLYTAAESSGVYASTNGGRSWSWSGSGMGTERTRAVAVDPDDGDLYAMGETRFFRSTDRGRTWTVRALNVPLGEMVPGGDVLAVVPGGEADTLFLARSQTLLRSKNGGATWRSLAFHPASPITAILVDPRDPRSIFVGTQQIGGLFHSADGGATWAEVTNVQPPGLPPFENPFHFGIDQLTALPTSPTTLFALAGLALYRSTDGGASWHLVEPAPAPGAGYIDSVAAVSGESGAPDTIFTIQQLISSDGFAHHGLFSSRDRGTTWTRLDDGSEPFGRLLAAPDGELYALAVDAVEHGENSGVHWRRFLIGSQFCGASDLSDRGGLLRWTADGSRVYALVGFRLFVSNDGGRFWTARAQQLSESCIKLSDVQMDPGHPNTLYASTDRGVYKSLDGGLTWAGTVPGEHPEDVRAFRALALLPGNTLVGGACGIERSPDGGAAWQETLSCDVLHPEYGEPDFLREVTRLRVDPKRPRVLYAEVIEEGERHPPVFLPYVYRSTDGGATWQVLSTEAIGARAIAIDPKSPRTLYLAKDGEILRSTDDGRTWTRIGNPGAGASGYDLLVDPASSRILYSAGPLGVFRSTDGGATWSPFSAGLRGRAVLNLFRDPRRPTLYAGAGGLFQINVP